MQAKYCQIQYLKRDIEDHKPVGRESILLHAFEEEIFDSTYENPLYPCLNLGANWKFQKNL
jgi:hypothetical protein